MLFSPISTLLPLFILAAIGKCLPVSSESHDANMSGLRVGNISPLTEFLATTSSFPPAIPTLLLVFTTVATVTQTTTVIVEPVTSTREHPTTTSHSFGLPPLDTSRHDSPTVITPLSTLKAAAITTESNRPNPPQPPKSKSIPIPAASQTVTDIPRISSLVVVQFQSHTPSTVTPKSTLHVSSSTLTPSTSTSNSSIEGLEHQNENHLPAKSIVGVTIGISVAVILAVVFFRARYQRRVERSYLEPEPVFYPPYLDPFKEKPTTPTPSVTLNGLRTSKQPILAKLNGVVKRSRRSSGSDFWSRQETEWKQSAVDGVGIPNGRTVKVPSPDVAIPLKPTFYRQNSAPASADMPSVPSLARPRNPVVQFLDVPEEGDGPYSSKSWV